MILKMLRIFTAICCFLFLCTELLAQNCVLTGINHTTISSSCSQVCRDLTFQIPDIRSSSTYTVVSIPYDPYPYITAGATEDLNLYNDDRYSAVFNLPFPFCFYDSVYTKAVISSNGLVSFDPSYASCQNSAAAWNIVSTIPYDGGGFSCTPNDYPGASIMAAFMDLDPRPGPLFQIFSSPPDRKIEWRVEGTAPCRRFIVSYFHIGAFQETTCGLNPDSAATFQIVMYESTGLIDIFFQHKSCNAISPNGTKAILGIQNFPRTKAVAAPGKNATTWTASNEGYRFVPSGGVSSYVSSELLSMNLSHIAWASSSSSTPGLLDITFPNICSPDPSTQYIVRTIFSACDNPATQLIGMDTITINLTGSFNATATTTNTACGPPSGTITVNVPASAIPPFSYVLDGGTPVVTPTVTHTFTNVAQGQHTVVVTDGNNACASTINITVNQTNTLNAITSTTPTNACASVDNGTITVTPVNGSAPYSFSLDGAAPQAGTASFTFTNVTGGLHNIIVTDASNCVTNNIPVTVATNAVLTATVNKTDVLCNGQNNGVLTVNASGGVTPYQYSIDGTTYQTNNTFNVPAGTYTVFLKDNNGCINTIANINIIEPPPLTISATTQPVSCNGGADGVITATTGGGNSGYQYSIDGVNFQSSNSFNVITGNYTITAKDQNNCSITKNITVGLSNNLTFSKGNDTTICEGGSAHLVATSNATVFTWTPATALNNSSIANPVASPAITTQYTVTATLGGCSTNGTIRVTVNPAPVPNAGPDADICFGQNAQLSASGGTSYQWTPSTYLSSTTIPNPIVIQPQQNTQYTLQVKDANGCTSLVTDDVFVNITPPVRVIVSPKDSIVVEGDQIQLNATSIGTIYNWTNPFTLSNQNIPNPVASIPVGSIGNTYTYTVTASTPAGCKGTASVTLKVYKGPDIYLPTGFTPNGDGKNDKFHPISVGVKKINYLRVFNRWGQMVFSSTTINEGWDGNLGGMEQPNGVYVWVVQGVTSDDRVITKKGTVMLIR
jgi:gliding motility-associated-like protein